LQWKEGDRILKDSTDDSNGELQKIEHRTHVLRRLSERLDIVEEKMKEFSSHGRVESPSESLSKFQEIIMKITSLREVMERVEIEIDRLDSRINRIESLRFKHRTER